MLQNDFHRVIMLRVSVSGQHFIGMSPSGKAPDFDSGIRRFKSCHPSQHDPLAQPVEQLPFKQWARGSSPRRVTKNPQRRKVLGIFAVGDSKNKNRNMPVAYCCHQFKNWWLPIFSPREKANGLSGGSPRIPNTIRC